MVRLEPVQANPTLSQFFLSGRVVMCKICVVGSNIRENSALTPLFQIGGAAAVLGAQGDCAGMVQQHCLGLHLPLLLLILLT